ncbi:MAG: hypothetical protein ACOVQC_00515 [Flavobacterium sp.]
MKNLILITCILFFTNSNGQSEIEEIPYCDYITPHFNLNFSRNSNLLTYDPSTKYVINVFFTLVNDDSNNNYFTNNPLYTEDYLNTDTKVEDRFLKCVALMNINFNSLNIFFKYRGFQVVQNSAVNSGQITTYYIPEDTTPLGNTNNLSQYAVPNCMNIYFLKTMPSGASAGYATFGYPGMNVHSQRYLQPILSQENKLYKNLGHEIGHAFDLWHIYSAYNPFPSTHPLWQYANCEKVSRDSLLGPDLYNADFAGDFVIDTPATTNPIMSMFNNGCGSYVYDPNSTNCYNEPYENLIIGNFMSSGFDLCTPTFTPKQGERMRYYLQNDASSLTSNYYVGTFSSITTSIESLYEPFFVADVGSSNNSNTAASKTYTTNELFTGANVWNCGPFNMRFQPGFNYEFSHLPGILSQTVNNQPNIASSSYIGVKIPYISQTIENCNAPQCYSTFEPFTSGDVKSTTFIGSNYYTQEELDTIKVKDPELYQKLQSQLYHIITKTTDSGYTDQKVIYKN